MDKIITFALQSPEEICRYLAGRIRDARLEANLTQAGLADRAGVSLGSLKRFEHTGAISLESLVRLAYALRLEHGFADLFTPPPPMTLDEVLKKPKKRKRGRNT